MRLSLVIFLLLTSIQSYGGVNKWIDAEGKVHYSDMPPADIKSTTIRKTGASENSTATNDAAAPKTLVEREIELKKSQKVKEEASQKEAMKQEVASIKQKNCENARSNLTTLESGSAIVTYNPEGERTIIDDAARKQKTEEAREAISGFCN